MTWSNETVPLIDEKSGDVPVVGGMASGPLGFGDTSTKSISNTNVE